MARRPDPDHIHAAHRAGTLRRLESTGMSAERADAWIARWEAVAPGDGPQSGSAYWQAAWQWIEAQRR
jgi:hypothetical protein